MCKRCKSKNGGERLAEGAIVQGKQEVHGLQGFIQDFLLGGGGHNVSVLSHPPPPNTHRKKAFLESSENAFQAYFDQYDIVLIIVVNKIHTH